MKVNYKVCYVGLVEGYEVQASTDEIDNYDTFNAFSQAKKEAISRAANDIELAVKGLEHTKAITKKDVR